VVKWRMRSADQHSRPAWVSWPFNGHVTTTEQRTRTVIATLAEWDVTFGTARRGLGELRPRPVPSSLYQM